VEDECPGGSGLVDLLFFANLAVLIAGLGMFFKRPLLIGTLVSNIALSVLWIYMHNTRSSFVLKLLLVSFLCLVLIFIAGTAISVASFSHMSYIYDILHWLLFEHFRIGRAEYTGTL
jgi:hypothetical protein